VLAPELPPVPDAPLAVPEAEPVPAPDALPVPPAAVPVDPELTGLIELLAHPAKSPSQIVETGASRETKRAMMMTSVQGWV
jgi:hypothetical protein